MNDEIDDLEDFAAKVAYRSNPQPRYRGSKTSTIRAPIGIVHREEAAHQKSPLTPSPPVPEAPIEKPKVEFTGSPVTSYTELIAGIDAGRVKMGLRHLDFEVLIGVTQGHWGKAAGMLQVKKLGIEKIFDALRGAGLRLRLEVDPEQRAKMVARCADNFNPMHGNQARPRHSSTLPSTPVLNRVMQPWRKIGGKKRWAGKSKKEISEHMRMMAMARERKRRKAKKVAHQRRLKAKLAVQGAVI